LRPALVSLLIGMTALLTACHATIPPGILVIVLNAPSDPEISLLAESINFSRTDGIFESCFTI